MPAKKVRLARVIPRSPAQASRSSATRAHAPTTRATIAIAVGAIRVLVEPGFDAATLWAVVDMLDSRARTAGGAH